MLNNNRGNIVDAFGALQSFATVASHILAQTKDDFAADFKDLYPVIKALNDNADYFYQGSGVPADFPVPLQVLAKRGARATT